MGGQAQIEGQRATGNGLDDIANDALQCIEKVADTAETALRGDHGGKADSFASVNTFTGVQQVRNIRAIGDSEREALHELIRQPVIARVEYVDEDGKPGTIFVTRSTPHPVSGYRIASYRSPLGSIASRAVGEDLSVRIGGAEHEVEIVNSAKLKPQKTVEGWDSRDSEIDLGSGGKYTVVSLRDLRLPADSAVDEDAWDAWEHEGQEGNILEGIRRAVLSQMGLRDQPILDQHQDEIFRMPLDTRCFLSGPPGTGKTTTLIRRLGQKIDLDDPEALLPAERVVVERASQETGADHRTSWVMFSPTELLRQYVKEAFAREGFAASDHHIHTWDDYRDDIARNSLRLLRTSMGGGAFHKREGEYLDLSVVTLASAEWFDDFVGFYRSDMHEGLSEDAAWLAMHEDSALSQLGDRLGRVLKSTGPDRFIGAAPSELAPLIDEVRKHIDQGRDASQKIITRTLNRLVNEDRGFPAALKQEIERQLTLTDVDELDDVDGELDALDDFDNETSSGRTVTREEVKRRYTQAVTTYARARARRRKVSDKGRSSALLAWLGERRLPSDEDTKMLGMIEASQARLRRFSSFDALLFRSIPMKYRKFRAQRHAEGRWYSSLPPRSSDIGWQELDLLVLFSLRTASEMLSAYRRISGADLPSTGILGAVRSIYKNQVLVDEATDFSVLQLACMYELSHPLTRSFFMCGDLNQRLTGWGIKSYDEIDWIAPSIVRRKIVVSYRQSGHLVRFAKAVATLNGAEPDEIDLPDRLDIEGFPAVFSDNLSSDFEKADWLCARIREIENIVGTIPTIAILVNDEGQVEPLATALQKRLEDINLRVEACKDGKVVGKEHAVRVFNIRYIKGLEFEAVFFTDLDQTIENHPDLFSQYLYVGATRAATYLGVTFSQDVPAVISPLKELFSDAWIV